MPGVHEMKGERSRVHPLGDAQFYVGGESRRPALVDDGPHAKRRFRGILSVLAPGKEHQEGIASEFEDVAPMVLDDLNHLPEAPIEKERQILRTFPSKGGE